MTNENGNQNEIRDAFKNLGQNIKKAVDSAWDSEQRAHVQEQIEYGLDDLGTALENFVEDISNSEAGQKLKDGVEDFGERLRSGEVEQKAKEDLIKAIDYLNEQLDKLSEKFTPREPEE